VEEEQISRGGGTASGRGKRVREDTWPDGGLVGDPQGQGSRQEQETGARPRKVGKSQKQPKKRFLRGLDEIKKRGLMSYNHGKRAGLGEG